MSHNYRSNYLPQRSSSEPSKQSLTASHSGLILLRHFPLAHLYEDEGQPLRSKQNVRPELGRCEGTGWCGGCLGNVMSCYVSTAIFDARLWKINKNKLEKKKRKADQN